MVYRPKVDHKLCFVLMPFEPLFDSYYELIIKPAAIDAGLAALRSDEIRGRRAIVKDIWERIWAARVVVADVTTRNANVNYELGLCDALGVPAIIITASMRDVPFDYKHRRCIVYNKEEPSWDDKLRSDLADTIRAVLAEAPGEDELEWPYDTLRLGEAGSGGLLIASADSRKIVVRGAQLVRDAIASAFGPHGSSVAISQAFGPTMHSQRGSQIARGIKSANPLEEKGIEEIRTAASTVYDLAGDFSKLVCILAAGFLTKGQELIDKGFHPKDIVRVLERFIEQASKHIASQARPLTGNQVAAVGTTAGGGDKRIGALVAEAMKRAGRHGIIAIERSNRSETFLEVSEGMRFDRGYLSDIFVTDPQKSECVLTDCLVLTYQRRISSMKDLLPLLEQVAKSDKTLLIIAEDVEGEALATLTVNKIKGTLRCAAVKAPGEGERRKALQEDISILTGGTFFSDDLGITLGSIRLEQLGKAEKILITRDDTTIIGGAGSSKAIQARIDLISSRIGNTTNDYEREKLQERLAMLAGSVAMLKAGGISDAEQVQEVYRLESAMHSTRSSVENGTVAGGGVALFRAAAALKSRPVTDELEAQAIQAVGAVLEEPIRQLVENAKKSPTQVLAEIVESNSPGLGFNAEQCKVEDLIGAGVLDPARSIDVCLRVALSHASSVLQTGTWDLSPPPAPPRAPGAFRTE